MWFYMYKKQVHTKLFFLNSQRMHVIYPEVAVLYRNAVLYFVLKCPNTDTMQNYRCGSLGFEIQK